MSRNPLITSRISRSLSTSSPSSSYSLLQSVTFNTSCLQTLLKRGFKPTIKHINDHLFFLFQSHRFNSVIHFFSQIESHRINPSSSAYSLLTWSFLKLHKLEEAEHYMRMPSAKCSNFVRSLMWDSLIQGYCSHENDPEKGLSILLDCLCKYDVLPSSYSFCSLIHSFSSKGMMSKVFEVLELMHDEKAGHPFSNFVCSSVISGFSGIGKPEFGVDFFEKAKLSGLRPNIVTYTVLVDALCCLGRVDEVYHLFVEMEMGGLEFDVLFFTRWMCGYIRKGVLVEALLKNKLMLDKGVSADTVSYTVLIDGFSKEGNVEKAVGILAKMIKGGLKPNLVTYTALISGFCRKGKLDEAISLFRRVEDAGIVLDDFIYATLIDGACRRGDFNLVFDLLDDMEKKGINLSLVTYNTLINGFCKFGRMSEANEFSKRVFGDLFTYSTLLHGYIGEENAGGILETKRRLEESRLAMDTLMCNVLIKASFMVGTFEDAYTLYKGMPDMDLIPDSFTYCAMIDGYCRVGRINEALDVFDDFKKTLVSSVACYNCIIRGLCKNGMVDMGLDVFFDLLERELPVDLGVTMILIKSMYREWSAEGVISFVNRLDKLEPHIYSGICNQAICFLCKRKFLNFALDIYKMMRRRSLALTSKSNYLILKGLIDGEKHLIEPLLSMSFKEYGNIDPRVVKISMHYLCLQDINATVQFLDKIKKQNLVANIPSSAIKALTNCGRVLDAYKLVIHAMDFLPGMDVVDYSTLINGLCKGKYLDQALDLCTLVRKKGIALNIVSYNSVINCLCQQGRLIEAFRLFGSLERIGLIPSEITYATLIDTLCRERFMCDAEQIFQAMVSKGYEPSTHVFNSMLNGYGRLGELDEALRILQELDARGLSADGFTIGALINGYCQKGDMEGALGIFSEFKNKGVSPDFLGFLYLLRGLSTKGNMEVARNILGEMLHSESVLELLNRVPRLEKLLNKAGDDNEVSTASVYNHLVVLCEQKRVSEAIAVLNEIGQWFFPTWRFNTDNLGSQKETHPYDREDTKTVKKVGSDMKSSHYFNFDSFYSELASLCSRGELESVNLLLKGLCC